MTGDMIMDRPNGLEGWYDSMGMMLYDTSVTLMVVRVSTIEAISLGAYSTAPGTCLSCSNSGAYEIGPLFHMPLNYCPGHMVTLLSARG